MSKPNKLQGNIFLVLFFAALLTAAGSASAQLTVITTNQFGSANVWPFTPTWVVPTNTSLIAGLTPTTATGNFNLEIPVSGNRDVNSLTVNTNLTLYKTVITNTANGTTDKNYVTVGNGSGAGSVLVYTLPASANGYNLTNINFYGGWADAGRDALAFTVLYSTAADPASFIVLTSVQYNPSVAANTPSANLAIIKNASGGVIAANVAAVKFIFSQPNVENGYAGCAAITVGGTPAASIATPALRITTTTQTGASPFTPSFTLESPNLLAGMTPSTYTGNFTLETSGGVPVLTDGSIGTSGTVGTFATCGGGSGSGSSVVYDLTNIVNGTDVTNIVVYSGWGNADRDGQYYILSYATIGAPTTFVPLTTVYYNPAGTSGAVANRVAIAMNDGSALASGVVKVKLDFAGPPSAGSFDNGYQGFSEIVVQGKDTTAPPPPPSPLVVVDAQPTYAETVIGDQVVFSAVVSNSPVATLQWMVITNGITNIISGATGPTLTLNNVQVSDSGLYLLRADNATNGVAAPAFTTPRQLVVNTNPAAVNGVVMKYAGQTFTKGVNFVPTWPVDTNNLSLIYGFTTSGGAGGAGPGTISYLGDFTGGGNFCNADPVVMSDGQIAILTNQPNLAYCAGGTLNRGAGYQVTYWLQTNAAPYGLDITNITVFGGWQDAGRDEQKYQVLYSTVQDPSTFAPLVLADYMPSDSDASPVITRTTLVPTGSVLAHNVAALRISWNVSPEPKNGWEGYSEILAGGQPSTGFVPALSSDVTPSAASDVVGSQLVLTAGFANYTSLQWQHNGTNLPGATTSTLTLNHLQLSDGGSYSLVASNAVGGNSSSACVVTVNTNGLATNNILLAIAGQTSIADVFTPTWDATALSSSLLYGTYPSSSGEGDFTGGSFDIPTYGSGPSVLTDGTYGTIDFNNTGTHYWITCIGSGTYHNNAPPLLGGQYVTYTLPASANGYDLTNIVVAAGWNDGGRDQQSYTVRYATTANPTYFMPLTVVNYNPASPVGYSVNRATITAANGVLASNVVALQFDMSTPGGENGFSGYSEIAAYGSPSANPAPVGLQITVQHEESDTNLVNIWTPETPNLIAGQLPGSFSSGAFTGEGCTEAGLTDGVLAYGGGVNSASCGSTNSGAVSWIVFNATNGWDLTNIVVYSLWHDYGRDDQYYDVSYSTLTAPATFLPLTGIRVNPPVPHDGTASGNRVQITPAVGQTYLATNVAAVKFDFNPHAGVDYDWSAVTEIILQGTNLPAAIVPTLPTAFSTPHISGGNLILTGSGGTPAGYHYTWLSTTNLTPPVVWTTNVTGNLDGTGSFSNSVPVGTGPAVFFRFRMP